MNAVIKLKASELNASLLERIKALVPADADAEVTISVNDSSEYYEILNRSKKDLEEGRNLISFTMEELEEYTVKERP